MTTKKLKVRNGQADVPSDMLQLMRVYTAAKTFYYCDPESYKKNLKDLSLNGFGVCTIIDGKIHFNIINSKIKALSWFRDLFAEKVFIEYVAVC